MRFHPHVTVAAVAEFEGRFLMVRERVDGRVCYNQPAGHLESGETIIEAVIRETREETAREFSPEAIIGLYRWVTPSNTTFLRIAFSGKVTEEIAGYHLDKDIESAEWLTLQEIHALVAQLRSPLVARCLSDYQAGQRFPLEILQELM